MYRTPHDDHDGMKVWLGADEMAVFLALVEDTTYRIAFGLGLRSAEIIAATPVDLADGPTGTMLRVPEGKDRKYRETSVLGDLETTIRTVDDVRAESSGSPLVDALTPTVHRWVNCYADEAAEEEDDGWRDLYTTFDGYERRSSPARRTSTRCWSIWGG